MSIGERRATIRDRVVLITGASDGIGAACARLLRSKGARLSLTGRSAEKLARVATPEDLTTAADLTAPGTPELLVQRTVERFGRIDTLINSAGEGIYRTVADTPESETRSMWDLNFFAPLSLARAVIPYLRARGAGSIVNIGSIAGRVTLPWLPLYSASKCALGALTESLRTELRPAGIHVMLVCPGYVLTAFQEHAHGLPPPGPVTAGKRFAVTPEQCAAAIVSGIERKSRIVVIPRWGWLFIAMHHAMPRILESRLAAIQAP